MPNIQLAWPQWKVTWCTKSKTTSVQFSATGRHELWQSIKAVKFQMLMTAKSLVFGWNGMSLDNYKYLCMSGILSTHFFWLHTIIAITICCSTKLFKWPWPLFKAKWTWNKDQTCLCSWTCKLSRWHSQCSWYVVTVIFFLSQWHAFTWLWCFLAQLAYFFLPHLCLSCLPDSFTYPSFYPLTSPEVCIVFSLGLSVFNNIFHFLLVFFLPLVYSQYGLP